MDIGIISMRYAKALSKYATAHKAEDVLYREFLQLVSNYSRNPKLRKALENPILTKKEKLTLICAAANGEKESSPEFIRFHSLILDGRREFYLQYIALSFITLYRKMKHIGHGTLITAVPIDEKTEEEIRRIAAAMVHAEMELDSIVDPSIEGGFIFDINDFRLDASIATQLKRVKQQFIEKNKRIV